MIIIVKVYLFFELIQAFSFNSPSSESNDNKNINASEDKGKLLSEKKGKPVINEIEGMKKGQNQSKTPMSNGNKKIEITTGNITQRVGSKLGNNEQKDTKSKSKPNTQEAATDEKHLKTKKTVPNLNSSRNVDKKQIPKENSVKPNESNLKLNKAMRPKTPKTVHKPANSTCNLEETKKNNNIKQVKREASKTNFDDPKEKKTLTKSLTSKKPLQTLNDTKKHGDNEKPKPIHKNTLSIAIETESKNKDKDKEKKLIQNREVNRSTIETNNTNQKLEPITTVEEVKSQPITQLPVEPKPKPQPKNFKQNPYTKETLITDSWKYIGSYLNINDLIQIRLVTKSCYNLTKADLINLLKIEAQKFDENIKNIEKTYPATEIKKEVPSFTLTKGTSKAIELLNEAMYNKLFNVSNYPSEDILFPYKLYFLFLKHPILNNTNDQKFWCDTCKYFTEENKGKAGELIINSVKNFNFSEETLLKIIKMPEQRIKKITPTYYSKICGTTGLIVFLFRDIFEHYGLVIDKKTFIASAYKIHKYGQEKALKNIEIIMKSEYPKKNLILKEESPKLDNNNEKDNSINNNTGNILENENTKTTEEPKLVTSTETPTSQVIE